MQFETILLSSVIVWLAAVTGFILWFYRHLNSLVKESEGKPLIKVLEKLVDKEKKNSVGLGILGKKLDELEGKGLLHIQKIGVVRFNPFSETGGDHSFSLAVLDADDTGFVLTGLHTRERTRLYAKVVVRGKGEYNLSKEESQAIKKARLGGK